MRLVEVDVVVVVALVEVVVKVEVPPLPDEVDLIVVVPAELLAVGGFNGSRWNTPSSGVVTYFGPAPTAQPSCVFPGWPYTE